MTRRSWQTDTMSDPAADFPHALLGEIYNGLPAWVFHHRQEARFFSLDCRWSGSSEPHFSQQFHQHRHGCVALWQSIHPVFFRWDLFLFIELHSTRTLPQTFPMIPYLERRSKSAFPAPRVYQSRSCTLAESAGAAFSSGGTAWRISAAADGSSSHGRSVLWVSTTGIRSWTCRIEALAAVVRIV